MDNIDVTPGTGATIAADIVGGALHQRVKISQGADGSATDVSSAAPLQVTGANGTFPVSGTVTANLSATDNAVLDQIELNQDTQTALLTTIDADTSAIVTSVQLLDNAISGSEMQVDIVAALPAGTNNIGDVDIVSGTITTVSTLTSITNWGNVVDDAAFTPATTRVLMAGYTADETATDSVDEGDAGAARMTLDRKQVVANYAHTAGGATPYKLVSAASTNATSVKASAGQVYMITASNVNAAARYLKLYNKASAPTVGTDVPVFTFIIPGNTAGAGTNIPVPTVGLAFSTGIAFALTTEATDAGSTGVALSEIVVNLAYL